MTTSRDRPRTVRPTTFTARSPEDLLAFIPVALGFVPSQSVVMITLGASGPHARVDLPADDLAAEVVAAEFCHACVTHGVRRVVLVIYTPDPVAEGPLAHLLCDELEASGVTVLDVLGASPTRWLPLLVLPDHSCLQTYDAQTHPFRAEAVLAGQVVLSSREELKGRLVSDPVRMPGTESAWVALGQLPGTDERAQGEWIRRQAAQHAQERTTPDDLTAAKMLWGLERPVVRDRVWGSVRRQEARAQVDVWVHLVGCSPPSQLAAAAAVLAFVGWLSGHGALAWCAVDRSQRAGGTTLTDMVTRLLEDAVPPLDAQEVVLRHQVRNTGQE